MIFKNFAKFIKRRKFLTSIIILFSILLIIVLNFFSTLPDVRKLRTQAPGSTAMIEQRISEHKKAGKKFVIRKKWADLSIIPDLLKKTIIISEDIDFYNHHGIDYYELKESIKKNLLTGKKSRGGSTITQQLAKNLFLSTKKSYYRKIRELFIARKLEKHLSKNRILELYLNVIEFGHGIFGVGSASEFFFNKPVDRLTSGEIIRLISVVPKPLRVTPLSDSGYLKWRANLLLKRLLNIKYISEEEFHNLSEEFND